MNYIINPLYFYLMDITNKLNNILLALSVLGTVYIIITFVIALCCILDGDIEFSSFLKTAKFKVAVVVTLIIFALNAFIPSEDACEKMLIASFVTTDNIDATEEKTKEIIDYIFDKFEEMEHIKNDDYSEE